MGNVQGFKPETGVEPVSMLTRIKPDLHNAKDCCGRTQSQFGERAPKARSLELSIDHAPAQAGGYAVLLDDQSAGANDPTLTFQYMVRLLQRLPR